MKKILYTIAGVFIIILIVTLFIPGKTSPPDHTRVILEYTHNSYIAPPCFEQSDATNNIGEDDYAAAQEMDLQAHDSCTKGEMEAEESSLLVAFLKDIGLLSTKWDGW